MTKKKNENNRGVDELAKTQNSPAETDPLLEYETTAVDLREGVCLGWQDIRVSRKQKDGEMKEILKGVSGQARAGQLTFIMGGSGAGKTTLLNVLTNRNMKEMEMSGTILMNGREICASELKRFSAYVQQEDAFISGFSVYETLDFAAKLRNPDELDSDQRAELVEKLLIQLNLKKCQDASIGGVAQKSISRGERKRLAFACEILTNPSILFCDEPTSGLDSYMSHQVMSSLRDLAISGKTIICTIHQPSTPVFLMADALILLNQGQVVYCGPANKVDDYFAKLGYPLPLFTSSTEHFMAVLSKNNEETDQHYEARLKVCEEKNRFQANRKLFVFSALTQQNIEVHNNFDYLGDAKEQQSTGFARSWLQQFIYLYIRANIQLFRKKRYVCIKITQTMVISGVLGLVYLQVPIHRNYLLGMKGVIFATFQMNNTLFMLPSMVVFWEDYPVVVREFQANMYSPSAYFLAKTTADSLQYIIYPLIFSSIVYFLCGLPLHQKAMISYMGMSVAMGLIVTAMSAAVVSLFGDLTVSLIGAPLIGIPLMTFGGFLITFDSIPLYYKPIAYFSWYKYAFEAVIIAFFENVGEIPGCSIKTYNIEFGCSTGEQFIKDLDFSPDRYWYDWIAILLIFLFWKLLGLFVFTRRISRA
ncbi:unnamed protein product [Caenorhabditis bovis]|uniref:ABC transporter domain-containing protein n=1 Tax=Caenorhabditis bovis TaxID=2654633 RepID=A0A8S1EPG1_9PELO|nr:unnamed protein product [Caenorhabditis bovis]